MNFIEYKDFNNICRICLSTCNTKFLPDHDILYIYYKLSDGIPFEANELPQQICLKCSEKINEIRAFSVQCKEANSSLTKCLNEFKNVRIKEEQEEITIEENKIEFVGVQELSLTNNEINDELEIKYEPEMIQETSEINNINMSDSETEIAATFLPEKSKNLYEVAYKHYENWCNLRKIKLTSEKVVLAYFTDKVKVKKPSSLWSHYSMLRTTINMKQNVDISKFKNVLEFLKRNAEGYKPKKSRIFSKDNLYKFLKDANDQTYLAMKVTLIVGIAGGCRKDELVRMRKEDVQDFGSFFKITIPNNTTKVPRIFTITEGNLEGLNLVEIVRKYVCLRPVHTNHNRFFVALRNGKCSIQPIGINTFSQMPKKIAIFLGLQNPGEYTGHCFRRSSQTLQAEVGAYC